MIWDAMILNELGRVLSDRIEVVQLWLCIDLLSRRARWSFPDETIGDLVSLESKSLTPKSNIDLHSGFSNCVFHNKQSSVLLNKPRLYLKPGDLSVRRIISGDPSLVKTPKKPPLCLPRTMTVPLRSLPAVASCSISRHEAWTLLSRIFTNQPSDSSS